MKMGYSAALLLFDIQGFFDNLNVDCLISIMTVMAAYNIFGFQLCALKVMCTVTCFITWSVT